MTRAVRGNPAPKLGCLHGWHVIPELYGREDNYVLAGVPPTRRIKSSIGEVVSCIHQQLSRAVDNQSNNASYAGDRQSCRPFVRRSATQGCFYCEGLRTGAITFVTGLSKASTVVFSMIIQFPVANLSSPQVVVAVVVVVAWKKEELKLGGCWRVVKPVQTWKTWKMRKMWWWKSGFGGAPIPFYRASLILYPLPYPLTLYPLLPVY